MHKKLTIVLLATAMIMVMAAPALGSSIPTVKVNGHQLQLDVAPVMQDDQCLVPLRTVLEAMGASVAWDDEAQGVKAFLPGLLLELSPDTAMAWINGQKIEPPVMVRISNDRVMVPANFIAAATQCSISWDSSNASVSYTYDATGTDAIDFPGSTGTQSGRDVLYQLSTINALMEGLYDGQATFADLKKHGDLGIGTFAGLDGEMIELGGKIYQVKADGIAYPVADDMQSPLASVTFFDADQTQAVNETASFEQLQAKLDSMLTNKNIFYAIKVSGDFNLVKTRSVPAQQKPYPRLVEVTKNQPTFELQNVKGTLVGFWCPAYAQGICVPGYHLHFLADDLKAGGHLLALTMSKGQIEIDATTNIFVSLPENDEFGQANLSTDKSQEINQAEK